MTWFDYGVLFVLFFSTLLSFFRGFTREFVGIVAWIGAFISAYLLHGALAKLMTPYLDPGLAGLLSFAAVFIILLVIFLFIAGRIGNAVRSASFGLADRILGILFGLARGALFLIAAYIIAGLVVPVHRWPAGILESKSLPYIMKGADWTVSQIPEHFRPHLSTFENETASTVNNLVRQGKTVSHQADKAARKADQAYQTSEAFNNQVSADLGKILPHPSSSQDSSAG